MLNKRSCSKTALLITTGEKTGLAISLECEFQQKSIYYWILPTAGPLRKKGDLSASIFSRLNEKTFPEKMPGERGHYSGNRIHYLKHYFSISIAFRSLEEGKSSFEEVQEYLRRYQLVVNPLSYQYFIQNGWSFSVIAIKGDAVKGLTKPIWIELSKEQKWVPLSIFKKISRVDLYLLSSSQYDLEPLITKGEFTTIEREYTQFSQRNRITLLSHLGGEIERIYKQVMQKSLKKSLFLYHLYRFREIKRGVDMITIK